MSTALATAYPVPPVLRSSSIRVYFFVVELHTCSPIDCCPRPSVFFNSSCFSLLSRRGHSRRSRIAHMSMPLLCFMDEGIQYTHIQCVPSTPFESPRYIEQEHGKRCETTRLKNCARWVTGGRYVCTHASHFNLGCRDDNRFRSDMEKKTYQYQVSEKQSDIYRIGSDR